MSAITLTCSQNLRNEIMNTLHKELCTTAIVVTQMETAEALQRDVYSKWEGAELLEGGYTSAFFVRKHNRLRVARTVCWRSTRHDYRHGQCC